MIKLKWVYDHADVTDGERILAERSWPRGIRRSTTNIDFWIKDAGPSLELRRWYIHNPSKWNSFKARYRRELADGKALRKLAFYVMDKDPVTLLYICKDAKRSSAAVLVELLRAKVIELRRSYGGAREAVRAYA
jgi:uncharacterized protein YeaO (DUF488 family)